MWKSLAEIKWDGLVRFHFKMCVWVFAVRAADVTDDGDVGNQQLMIAADVGSRAHYAEITESSSYLCYLNSLLGICWVYKSLLFFPLGVRLPGQLCLSSTGQPRHVAV